MEVRISAAQRDALYSLVIDELNACEDLRLAYESEDLETAYRLGRRVNDALRLIVDGGLGWGARVGGPVELALPAEDLLRIFGNLRRDATNLYESMRPEREELQAEWEEIKRVQETCDEVLEKLRS
ncbi:MAG TPA: hypothetical protein VFY69_04585 [Solirubrobacterales bacterium]|nr:hypothetical protein [Solirubrobacterales bacterium]